MKCEKCGEIIHEDDIYRFNDKKVCDDCYIDLVEGVPRVDISNLPDETQWRFYNIMKRWFRDRPNRHRLKMKSFDG